MPFSAQSPIKVSQNTPTPRSTEKQEQRSTTKRKALFSTGKTTVRKFFTPRITKKLTSESAHSIHSLSPVSTSSPDSPKSDYFLPTSKTLLSAKLSNVNLRSRSSQPENMSELSNSQSPSSQNLITSSATPSSSVSNTELIKTQDCHEIDINFDSTPPTARKFARASSRLFPSSKLALSSIFKRKQTPARENLNNSVNVNIFSPNVITPHDRGRGKIVKGDEKMTPPARSSNDLFGANINSISSKVPPPFVPSIRGILHGFF